MISYHMVKGWKTIVIKDETYKKLQKSNNENNQKLKINPFIDEMLLMNLEKEDFLTNFYAPYIKYIGIGDNQVILKDSKLNRVVEITFHNEYITCSENECTCCDDKNKHCVHISYVLSLPELSGFLINNPCFKKATKTRL